MLEDKLEKIMDKLRIAVVASLLAAGCASVPAADAAKPEASIPFVNLSSSIRSWQADGRQGIWIQDARKEWYYAKLTTICNGLDFAVRVGFQTRTTGTLDRFGAVVVPGEPVNCQISSLTKSESPPDEKKNRKVEATESK